MTVMFHVFYPLIDCDAVAERGYETMAEAEDFAQAWREKIKTSPGMPSYAVNQVRIEKVET